MKTAAVTAVLAGVLLLTASPALAHAAYKSSDPAKNEEVSQPPNEVEVELTEPVTDDSYLEVFDPCGDKVDQGNSMVVGFTITVGVQADKAGTYAVAWHAFAVDGHPTEGTFVFHSASGSACPAAASGEEEGSATASGAGSGPGGDGASGGGNGGGGNEQALSSASGSGSGSKKDSGDSSKVSKPKEEGGNGAALAAALEGGPTERSKSLLDLPYQHLLVGWLLAAGIGAVGGIVYVGIVGPRRR